MRVFLVCLSVALALALWVWVTGPGTTIPLAVGAWIFSAAIGRLTYVLLRRSDDDEDKTPQRPDLPAAVIRPRPRDQL
jgi:hypothetical protein